MSGLFTWMFIGPCAAYVMIVGLVFDGDTKRAGDIFPSWVWNLAERSLIAGMIWPVLRLTL